MSQRDPGVCSGWLLRVWRSEVGKSGGMVRVEGASNRLGLACNQVPGGRVGWGGGGCENPSSVNRNFHSMATGRAGPSAGAGGEGHSAAGLEAVGAAQLRVTGGSSLPARSSGGDFSPKASPSSKHNLPSIYYWFH